MHEVLEAPEHEPPGPQEAVDVAEQGLALVDGVELDLDLEEAHVGEDPLGAPQHVELATLDVELDDVDRRQPVVGGPAVQGRQLDGGGADRGDHGQLGALVDQPPERRVERRAGGLDGEVEGRSPREGPEGDGCVAHPVVGFEGVEPGALLGVGVEADDPHPLERAPPLAGAPPGTDVHHDQVLGEAGAEGGGERCVHRQSDAGSTSPVGFETRTTRSASRPMAKTWKAANKISRVLVARRASLVARS